MLVILLSGVFTLHAGESASAVTDSCSGVATNFTATAPASVVVGQSFTLSNLTTQPSTSYGVTVTSAVLNLSASNATPTSYSQNDSSTVPSPTTGAANYIAYYPNWSLTATGSAGSVVAVNLVSVVAQVSGIGSITCPLSATLASIKIYAPASSSSSGSSVVSSGTSSAKSTAVSSSASSNPTTSSTSTTSPSGSVTKTVTATEPKQAVTIVVENSQNRPVKGAGVSIDNLPVVYTNSSGHASFKNVTEGNHQVSVAFNKQKDISTVRINAKNTSYVVPLKTATASNMKGDVALSIAVLAFICLAGFWLIRRRRSMLARPILSPVTTPTLPQTPSSQPSLPPSPTVASVPPSSAEPTSQPEQPSPDASIPVVQPPPEAPVLPDSPDSRPPDNPSQSGS